MTPILISLAGSAGAASRFFIDGHIKTRYNRGFPWATLAINVTGSLLLGLVSGILLHHKGFAAIGTVVGVGFCGGYTTFSTASFEAVRLMEQRRYALALGHVAGGALAAIAAAAAGIFVGQLV